VLNVTLSGVRAGPAATGERSRDGTNTAGVDEVTAAEGTTVPFERGAR
jgi:hypothetical protein